MVRWWWILAFVLPWEVLTNTYDGYSMIKLIPNTEEEVEKANGFNDPLNMVEVLKLSRGIGDSVDMLVPADRIMFVEDFGKQMMLVVKCADYGKVILDSVIPKRRSYCEEDPTCYMSYDGIQSFISRLAKRYPKLITVEYRGKSYEGRPMRLVKISSNPDNNNPVIFVDAGIHAREWVAPAMAMYLISQIPASYTESKKDLSGVDWYILPVVNPDGYEYSRRDPNTRLWRKTRSSHLKTGSCQGVDGNRNYAFKWGQSGISHNPCDKEQYAGPTPFSEPETQIVRDIMMQYRDRIKLYVSLHSYGNYLVYPWGYTGAILPPSWKQLDLLAREVSKSVEQAGGEPFKVLSAGRWYPASGGSDDYAYGVVGIPYSYTMEMTDGYEFTFPEYKLRVVLPQYYQGFMTFAKHIKKNYGPPPIITAPDRVFKKGSGNWDWLQRYRKKLTKT